MKIGIIGANGRAGSRIMKEAIDRGHEVTAIVRDASKLGSVPTDVLEKDLFQLTTEDVSQFDVLVNAFRPVAGEESLSSNAINLLIEVLQNTNTRLIAVGGAGSLFVDEEKQLQLMDSPNFPKEYLPTAVNMGKVLDILKETDSISWTFISPSSIFALGKRTGSYIIGQDNVLYNSTGKSYVSFEDYAIAVLDEIENPKYQNQRFTVASESE